MKKKFLWIGIFLTLVVVTVAIFYTKSADSRTAASGLKEAKEKAKQLGLPTTMGEVPYQNTTGDDNAAHLVLQAANRVETSKNETADLMLEAAKKGTLAFEWSDFQKPTFWQDLRFQQSLSALLDLAESSLVSGDVRGFRQRMTSAVKLSHMLAQVPTEEGFNESLMAERQCYERLGRFMVEHSTQRWLMPEVQAITFDERSVKPLLVGLRKFVAQGNEIAQNREIDGDQKFSWIWSKQDFPTDPWGRDALEATHLEGAISLVLDLDAAQDWIAAMKAMATKVELWQSDPDPLAYTLKQTSHSIKDLPTLAAENETARRILFVAAGAFRSKFEKGMFPAESPIKGEMEIDPFTVRPMKYSNPGTGFYIYSLGVDKMDSSGTADEGLTIGLDIGFKYRGFDPRTKPLNTPN